MGNLCATTVQPTEMEAAPEELPMGHLSALQVAELRAFLENRGILDAKQATKALADAKAAAAAAKKAKSLKKKGDKSADTVDAEPAFAAGDLSIEDVLQQVSAFDGSFVFTDPREKNHPVVYLSKEFEKLTGFAKFEFIGRNCKILQGKKTSRDSQARLESLVQNDAEGLARVLNYTAMGVPFENIVFLKPLQQAGKTKLWFGAHAAAAIVEPKAKQVAQQDFKSAKDKKKEKKKKSKQSDFMEEVVGGGGSVDEVIGSVGGADALFPVASQCRVRSLTTNDNKKFGGSHPPNTEPMSFHSQYVRGTVLVKTRGKPVMLSVADFFENNAANVEIQLQFELAGGKEIPADKYTELHIGFEVREPLGETWTSQFVNRILLACIDNARPHDASRAHMSFGKYRIMSKMASSSASASSQTSRLSVAKKIVPFGSESSVTSTGSDSNALSSATAAPTPAERAAALAEAAKLSAKEKRKLIGSEATAVEHPHLVYSLGGFADRLIVTAVPTRESRMHIPVLTLMSSLPAVPLPGAEDVTTIYNNGDDGAHDVQVRPGHVYTLSVATSMIDLETWSVKGVPGVRELSLNTVLNECTLHLVCYTLGPAKAAPNQALQEQRDHSLRDRTLLFDIELSHASKK